MAPEVVNKNKNCVFNGPYAGRDLYITMYQDSEREFVVTHNADIKPVSYFTGRETELKDLRQRIEEGRKSVLVSGMGGIGKTHICRKLFEEYLNKHAEDEGGSFRHIGYIEYNGDMGSSLISCLKFKQQESPGQNQEAVWRELEYLASDGKLLLFMDFIDGITPKTIFLKNEFIGYLSDKHEKEQGVILQEDVVQNMVDLIILRAKEHEVIRIVKSHNLIESYEIVHDE